MIFLDEIDADTIRRANARHDKTKKPGGFDGSMTDGEGYLCGLVGEEMVRKLFNQNGIPVVGRGTKNFDLICGDKKVEVKTSRQKGDEVEGYYNVHVEDRSKRGLDQQDCDVYVFCRVRDDCLKGVILGWALHWEVYNRSRWKIQKEGEIIGYKVKRPVKADNYILEVSKLAHVSFLCDYIKHWKCS